MVRAGIEICPRHLENNAGGCLTVIEDFRHKLERCDSDIAGRLAVCQAQARENVDLPGDSTPPQQDRFAGWLPGERSVTWLLAGRYSAVDRNARPLLPVHCRWVTGCHRFCPKFRDSVFSSAPPNLELKSSLLDTHST